MRGEQECEHGHRASAMWLLTCFPEAQCLPNSKYSGMGPTPESLRRLPLTSLSAAALPCATPLDEREMEPLHVVPQGPWRPPMTFREATSEGQSDDT